MRIALLGANGQLGHDLGRVLADHDLSRLTRADCDVTDHDRIRAIVSDLRPDVILNTTAYHRVDDCEADPETPFRVNAIAVLNLARVANDLDACLVHFSTDYVFDGKSRTPYTETSPPLPLSVYGNSKLSGEYIVRAMARKHMVIRTCGLYGKAGSRGKGGNFVETMLTKAGRGDSIRVVDDQILTPTSTQDLAMQVAALLPVKEFGLYHITNEGACSWHEFAMAVFELAGVRADLSPTTSEIYKTPAVRPRYSVLENARLKHVGLNRMRHWRDALSSYVGSRL